MSANARSAPIQVINTVTSAFIEAQFNPEEFEENFGVEYARQVVPGMSQKVKQFVVTDDMKVNFELFWHSATDGDGKKAQATLLYAKAFLIAACHPYEANDIAHGGTPRMLLTWPNFISLECQMSKLKFRTTRWSKDGYPCAYRASLELEQVRDDLVTMDQLMDAAGGPIPGAL